MGRMPDPRIAPVKNPTIDAVADPVIDLGSLAGLLAHDHELHAYCPPCDRWTALPLAELVARGQGALRLPLRVRCRTCGTRGELQVRPPRPAWSNSNGWVELR